MYTVCVQALSLLLITPLAFHLYRCWAAWAASSLAAQLRGSLERDDLFAASASVTPLSWRQVHPPPPSVSLLCSTPLIHTPDPHP